MGFGYSAPVVDVCGGHASDDGWYRYQNVAGCLQEQAMLVAGLSSSDHSPQLGWSYVSQILHIGGSKGHQGDQDRTLVNPILMGGKAPHVPTCVMFSSFARKNERRPRPA